MTDEDKTKAGPAPYWSPLTIDGKAIDLSHLEPFRHTFQVTKLGRDLTYDVKFSNHCFTEAFKEGVHDEGRKIMDGVRARAFCEIRHAFSMRLPAMIRDLPNQMVSQTRIKRNYVYAAQISDGTGGSYSFYFTITKERTTWHQLAIMVESAYRVDPEQLAKTLEGTRSIPFAVLCADTFLALPVRPRSRR